MAKVRIGISTYFELENELVGIGTDNPTNTLQVLGNIQSSDAKVIGVTTLTTYSGFTDSKLSLQGSAGAKQSTTSDEIIIEGEVTVSTGTTYTSGPENLTATDNFNLPGISDDKPSEGTMRFNEDLGSLEFYNGVEWKAVNSYVDIGNRGRGVMGGGGEPGTSPYNYASHKIDYINIPSLGDSINFGTLSLDTRHVTAVSNETRGIFYLGYTEPGTHNNILEYITIASQGNSIDFGDRGTKGYASGSCSSSTRGIWAGGQDPSGQINSINYVEIMTKGDVVDFGDLTTSKANIQQNINSPTRGLWGGGSTPTYISQIDTIIMASKGNARDYGDLSITGTALGGASNSIRGFFAGGYTTAVTKVMQQKIIASSGNTTYFGDLQRSGSYHKCLASQTRGIITSGSPSIDTVLQYIELESTGNSMFFGDLNYNSYEAGTLSDCHGGLGGF